MPGETDVPGASGAEPIPTPVPAMTPFTVVDPARQQALDLLGPLMRPIARQADQLDLRFRSYLESCRPDFRGGPRPGASRYWFMVWTDKADIEWKDEMATENAAPQALGQDCRLTWIEVVEGAAGVGTALVALEEAARTNGILPGHVEDLLAAHRLSGWREHFDKRRRRQ